MHENSFPIELTGVFVLPEWGKLLLGVYCYQLGNLGLYGQQEIEREGAAGIIQTYWHDYISA